MRYIQLSKCPRAFRLQPSALILPATPVYWRFRFSRRLMPSLRRNFPTSKNPSPMVSPKKQRNSKNSAMRNILKATDFKNLGTKKVGKVRDIYIQDDRLILISTDRHSSFDRIIAYIPNKGQVL